MLIRSEEFSVEIHGTFVTFVFETFNAEERFLSVFDGIAHMDFVSREFAAVSDEHTSSVHANVFGVQAPFYVHVEKTQTHNLFVSVVFDTVRVV